MKVYKFLIILLLVNALKSEGQEIFTPPLKPTPAFTSGENLTYQIRYGFIVGGITTFMLKEELYEEKLVFHAKAIGQTTGVAHTLYGVTDIYESWFDKETNLPYKQVRDIKEGHYTSFNEVTYNRINNTVNSKVSGEHKVPEKILDLASTFYYLRRLDFSKINEGEVIFVNMYFADEIFPFRLRYKGKETIRTKFGKISCIKICPVVEVGRMFKTQDDLTIWFSDDENHLPVLVKMDISVVGAVILKLVKFENTASHIVFLPEE
jgi:hypothetical protein